MQFDGNVFFKLWIKEKSERLLKYSESIHVTQACFTSKNKQNFR